MHGYVFTYFKSKVSFAEHSRFCRALLQKRPMTNEYAWARTNKKVTMSIHGYVFTLYTYFNTYLYMLVLICVLIGANIYSFLFELHQKVIPYPEQNENIYKLAMIWSNSDQITYKPKWVHRLCTQIIYIRNRSIHDKVILQNDDIIFVVYKVILLCSYMQSKMTLHKKDMMSSFAYFFLWKIWG